MCPEKLWAYGLNVLRCSANGGAWGTHFIFSKCDLSKSDPTPKDSLSLPVCLWPAAVCSHVCYRTWIQQLLIGVYLRLMFRTIPVFGFS